MANKKKAESRKPKPLLLYVDDEQWLMNGVVDSLAEDYNVVRVGNADQVLDTLENTVQRFDIIVIDIMMPQGRRVRDNARGRRSGVELARMLHESQYSNIPIVCYTVVTDPNVYTDLKALDVREVVSKRLLPSQLKLIIKQVLAA